jgi:transposase-like protein
MEEIFYVQLDNAKDFRKNALEATKLVIQVLQSAERLKKIRQDKADSLQKMNNLMQEIDRICEDIKIVPPPLDVSTRPAKKIVKKQVKVNAEANALADAISQIEQKLKRLG